jgi:nucleoside-diphosphate-sugar epimerase
MQLNLLAEYYADKNVVVAGGAGFVGIQLVRLLADVAKKVLVLDNFSRGLNIVDRENVHYSFETGMGMYLPYELAQGEEAFRRRRGWGEGCDVARETGYSWMLEGYDAFFNLTATVAGVLHNENNHLQMYHDNVRVLASPLRACEQAGVPAFFQTSSVCVYAEDRQSPCDESVGWGGKPHPANWGYAEAKRDGERMAQWANIEKVVIGRPSNVIGPYDYFDSKSHVVPAFVHRAITTEGTFEAYGSATIQREFIYSWDVAVGMAWALAFGENGEAYNIGANGDNTITMLSLATKIMQIYHSMLPQAQRPQEERRVLFNKDAGGGDDKRWSNAEKLRSLGWTHTIDLDTALKWVVEEYMFRGGWSDSNRKYWELHRYV